MTHRSRDAHRVRSYELDSYGHVNNAVFMQWFEHGRSRFLQDRALSYHRIEERFGVRIVIVAARIDFKGQLVLDDAVEIRTRVSRYGRSSLAFEQEVVLLDATGADRRTVATGEATMVFTAPDMSASVPIPDGFRELYT